MKLIYILLLSVSQIIILSVQPGSELWTKTQTNNSNRTQLLQLTTRIINQHYCAADPDLCILRMGLELTYTNTGQPPVILHKGSNKVTWVLISRSREDAAAGQYEERSHTSYVCSDELNAIKVDAPSSDFVIIKPGDSYKSEAEIVIGVTRDGSNKPVVSGEHVLQVIIPTWPGSNDQAKRLQYKWEKVGLLWFNSITSEPMPFTVEKDPLILDCSQP